MYMMAPEGVQAVTVSAHPLHGAQPFWAHEQSVCNK